MRKQNLVLAPFQRNFMGVNLIFFLLKTCIVQLYLMIHDFFEHEELFRTCISSSKKEKELL